MTPWIGLQVVNRHSAVPINESRHECRQGMTDDLAFEALAKFPAGVAADYCFMNHRALKQLRRSRTKGHERDGRSYAAGQHGRLRRAPPGHDSQPEQRPVQNLLVRIRSANDAQQHPDVRGCLACATSDDLVKWQLQPPVYSPGQFHTVETPSILEHGGRHYLVFMTHPDSKSSTTRRLSASPSPPSPANALAVVAEPLKSRHGADSERRQERGAQEPRRENPPPSGGIKRTEADFAKTLGLSGKVKKEGTRQAYRKAMQDYHPDRVAHLGIDLRMLAEEKAKEINEAYDYFRKRYRL